MPACLEFVDLTRAFDRDGYKLQVSGTLETGQILAVQGPSGSGKSTLLKMLARVLAPDAGSILYRGQDYRSISALQWRRKIQYLSQKPVLFEGSVEDNFTLPFTLIISRDVKLDRDFLHLYMEELGLSREMLQQSAPTLSGGEAARVALIRALLVNPEILLLDEPSAYLDDDSSKRLWKVLKDWLDAERNRAMVVVSHKKDDLLTLPGVTCLNLSG